MRILIAEDDQVLADGLLRSLRASGYAVDQVASGSEADAALAAHEFDLVILDLNLPKLHGFEVLRKLRARGTSVPVLILNIFTLVFGGVLSIWVATSLRRLMICCSDWPSVT